MNNNLCVQSKITQNDQFNADLWSKCFIVMYHIGNLGQTKTTNFYFESLIQTTEAIRAETIS